MRTVYSDKLEKGRILNGEYGTLPGTRYGAFCILGPLAMELRVIADDGRDAESEGWEHVSVSGHRCPNWEEMCFVKDLFWDFEECVVQFHPPRSQYVSFHPTCLHLWGRIDKSLKTPPVDLVGPRTAQDLKRLQKKR